MMADNFIIGGVHSCTHCLRYNPELCIEVWIANGDYSKLSSKTIALIETLGITIHEEGRHTLTKIYGSESHNGIVLRRKPPKFENLEPFLNSLDKGNNELLLVLDRIQDPRNFGACLRVAECAGVTAVMFPKRNSALFGATLAKASSGAIDSVRMVRVPNISIALAELKKCGIWIFGADSASNDSFYANDCNCSVALVMGNEGTGLKSIIRKNCDKLVSLPMKGAISSLNIATAAGIMLFEANRQRI